MHFHLSFEDKLTQCVFANEKKIAMRLGAVDPVRLAPLSRATGARVKGAQGRTGRQAVRQVRAHRSVSSSLMGEPEAFPFQIYCAETLIWSSESFTE